MVSKSLWRSSFLAPPWWLTSITLQTLEDMQSLWSIWWNKRSTYSYTLTCFANSIHNKAYFGGINIHKGLPRWLSGKEFTCQCRGYGFYHWDRKIPWRRKWQCTPIFLPGKSHGQRVLAGYSPWGHKRVGENLVTKTAAAIYGKQAILVYSLIHFYTCAHMYRA